MQEYTAFISYRHKPLDIAAAKALHTRLENFRIPAYIRQATGIKKVGRCFRDQEELPTSSDLAHDILDALSQSQWLIVICSPDTPHSKWCAAEIETFIRMHGRSRVLAVLISGEPQESFPYILRFEPAPDGGWIEREPLAADIRAKSAGLMKRKLRVEKFRLLAPILGVAFDDLRRRARERMLKLALTASAAAIAILASFGGYASWQAAVISRQNSEITQKNDDLEIQIAETERQRERAQQNEEEARRQSDAAMLGQFDLLCELSKNAVADGNRLAGIRYALDSADIYDTMYPDGNAEKKESLRQTFEATVYTGSFQQLAPLRNNGRRLGYAEYSPDDSLILCGMGEYAAGLFDAQTGALCTTITRSRPYMDNYIAFLSFSPSGRYFVTGFGASTCDIIIWETGTAPKEIASFHAEENFVRGGFISENELMLGRITNQIENPVVWDFSTDSTREPSAAEIASFNSNLPAGADGGAGNGRVISPDGAYMYVSEGDMQTPVRVYETAGSRLIAEIPGATILFALSHDNRRLIAGNAAGVCSIYSTPASSTAATIDRRAEADAIFGYPKYFDVLRDEPLVLNTNYSYNSSLYNWSQPYMINEPSGRFISMVYPDGAVSVWDLERDATEPSYILHEHIGALTDAYMTRDYLITAGQDGRLMAFDLHEGAIRHSNTVEHGIVSVNLDPSGTKVAAIDGLLKNAFVYDLNTGLPIYRLDTEPEDAIDMYAFGFSVDGRQVIITQQSGRTITGELFSTFEELRVAAAEACPRG